MTPSTLATKFGAEVSRSAACRRKHLPMLRSFIAAGGGGFMLRKISIGAAAAALLMSLTQVQAFDDAKYPDLKGQWLAIRLGVRGQPAFDPTKPWGLGQQAPLTAEYQKILEASVADQAQGGQGNWLSGI